ncbi:uncharacterized protein BO95DRAFT_377599, partial [Aspergillus brunneoviolaceus CBS 621.78]
LLKHYNKNYTIHLIKNKLLLFRFIYLFSERELSVFKNILIKILLIKKYIYLKVL